MRSLALSYLSLFLLSSLTLDARIIETQCPKCGKYYIVGSYHKCTPNNS